MFWIQIVFVQMAIIRPSLPDAPFSKCPIESQRGLSWASAILTLWFQQVALYFSPRRVFAQVFLDVCTNALDYEFLPTYIISKITKALIE